MKTIQEDLMLAESDTVTTNPTRREAEDETKEKV
jgi:hypothetical protein